MDIAGKKNGSIVWMKCSRQKWIRTIADRFYDNESGSLSGNDDCGQMPAWYIFACLGFLASELSTIPPNSANSCSSKRKQTLVPLT